MGRVPVFNRIVSGTWRCIPNQLIALVFSLAALGTFAFWVLAAEGE